MTEPTPLEKAQDAALQCLHAASELQRIAHEPLGEDNPTVRSVEYLMQACDLASELIPCVNDQLTAVANTDIECGVDVFENLHRTAYQYAARMWFEVLTPEGRTARVVPLDKDGNPSVSEVGLKNEWPRVRAAILRLDRPDDRQLRTLRMMLKQESARAKLGRVKTSDGPSRPGFFIWKGQELGEIPNTPWLLLCYLWGKSDNTALWSELSEPVWRDREIYVDENRFGPARRTLNHFFERNGIPLKVKGAKAQGNDRLAFIERLPEE